MPSMTVLRRSGLHPVGEVPWGTHVCAFYETTDDLIDLLVPYFTAGLESNERCVWITSPPLTPDSAEDSVRSHVADFDRMLAEGRMKFIAHTDWYLKDGVFDMERVLAAWAAEAEDAVGKGFDGLRVSGSTAWLETSDWEAFAEYERTIDSAIVDSPMLVL